MGAFVSPITARYWRLSVGFVGNTGQTSGRDTLIIHELTLNQNTANNVIVPSLISNKTTFTDNNELISKSYSDLITTPLETKTQKSNWYRWNYYYHWNNKYEQCLYMTNCSTRSRSNTTMWLFRCFKLDYTDG